MVCFVIVGWRWPVGSQGVEYACGELGVPLVRDVGVAFWIVIY